MKKPWLWGVCAVILPLGWMACGSAAAEPAEEVRAAKRSPAAAEPAAQHSPAQHSPAKHSPAEEVRAAVALYAEAFNSHDAAALAARWSAEGVHLNTATGERTTGRAAIERDFAQLFAAKNDLTLGVRVDTIRFIRPDVAQITGQAVTVGGEEEPSDSTFTAVLVKERGGWLLDSVNETIVPAAPKPSDYLQELAFLVGRWVDDSDEARVDTTVRWGANHSFLVRSYTVRRGEGVEQQGTQVIGWDPRNERIRCWMFDSDGSFGEGTWQPTEEGWVVKLTRTLADGRSAGGTQVITKVDHETLTVQSIGMEVEGAPLPSSEPVRVVRVADGE